MKTHFDPYMFQMVIETMKKYKVMKANGKTVKDQKKEK